MAKSGPLTDEEVEMLRAWDPDTIEVADDTWAIKAGISKAEVENETFRSIPLYWHVEMGPRGKPVNIVYNKDGFEVKKAMVQLKGKANLGLWITYIDVDPTLPAGLFRNQSQGHTALIHICAAFSQDVNADLEKTAKKVVPHLFPKTGSGRRPKKRVNPGPVPKSRGNSAGRKPLSTKFKARGPKSGPKGRKEKSLGERYLAMLAAEDEYGDGEDKAPKDEKDSRLCEAYRKLEDMVLRDATDKDAWDTMEANEAMIALGFENELARGKLIYEMFECVADGEPLHKCESLQVPHLKILQSMDPVFKLEEPPSGAVQSSSDKITWRYPMATTLIMIKGGIDPRDLVEISWNFEPQKNQTFAFGSSMRLERPPGWSWEMIRRSLWSWFGR